MTLLVGEAALAVGCVQAAAVGGAWLLRARERFLERFLPYLVSLAIGVLLGTALLDLLPEAVAQLGNRRLTWSLLGITLLALFAVERVYSATTGTATEPEIGDLRDAGHSHAQHHHHDACTHDPHSAKPVTLVLAAMLHSFIDGAAVAIAFATNTRIGWLTALAIALHEIPHRIGDFAVLIHLGIGSARALRLAVLAGVPSLVGVLGVFAISSSHAAATAYLLPISAGSFLYIATANLLPELQTECRLPQVLWQIVWLLAGGGVVALVAALPASA